MRLLILNSMHNTATDRQDCTLKHPPAKITAPLITLSSSLLSDPAAEHTPRPAAEHYTAEHTPRPAGQSSK